MLKAHEIVKLWEIVTGKPYWQRGVLMLAAIYPDVAFDELSRLSLGQRNQRLFRLRDSLFGTSLQASSTCPECAEGIEFELDSQIICDPGRSEWDGQEVVLSEDGVTIRLVMPSSLHLKQIEHVLEMEGESHAEVELLKACVVEYRKNNILQPLDSLPDSWLEKIADKIKDTDTHSEIRCRLSCPECEHVWSDPFDIVNFLWHEIEVKARIILSEVQSLAKAFGWWEGDILSLSDNRRKFYLEGLSE